MTIRFILAFALCTIIVACSVNMSLKNNEVSLVLYKDSLAVYRGALNKNTQVSFCSFDTSMIQYLLKKNVADYKGKFVLIIKPAPASDGNVANHINLIKIISNSLNLTGSIAFTLTENEKKYFQSDERSSY